MPRPTYICQLYIVIHVPLLVSLSSLKLTFKHSYDSHQHVLYHHRVIRGYSTMYSSLKRRPWWIFTFGLYYPIRQNIYEKEKLEELKKKRLRIINKIHLLQILMCNDRKSGGLFLYDIGYMCVFVLEICSRFIMLTLTKVKILVCLFWSHPLFWYHSWLHDLEIKLSNHLMASIYLNLG